MTHYLGIDLAWGEGTATRPPKETGLALIDETGTVLHAGWARGIDAVAAWIVEVAAPGAVIAIDAPLVVGNPTGMRLCERQVGMGYGSWHVAANASNTALGWQGGVALRTRLETHGFVYTDGIRPPVPLERTMFECYPYTTIVGMAELGYEDKRPRYKRFDQSLPSTLRRRARADACDELIRRMGALGSAPAPLHLGSHEVSRSLLEPSPLVDRVYKHREDMLDAVLCAWTAAIWHRHRERVQVLGADDIADAGGRRGTIVAPARDRPRVAGRVMRALPGASSQSDPGAVVR